MNKQNNKKPESNKKQFMPRTVAKSQVLKMGFTEKMIRDLLPAPKEEPNPYYKNAAPMKLWEESVVLEIMKTDAYQEAWEKASKRKKSAEKAQMTRKKRMEPVTVDVGDGISVVVYPDKALIKPVLIYKTRSDYEQFKETWDYKTHMCDRGVLYFLECGCYDMPDNIELYNRWAVNYIRQELVIVANPDYQPSKEMILEKVALAYPQFAKECHRQIRKILKKKKRKEVG